MDGLPNTNESERLKALDRYCVIQATDDGAMESLARLASQICRVPIALVTMAGESSSQFLAGVGWSRKEVARDEFFCSEVIARREVVVIGDTSKEERFRQLPCVHGDPGIRFFAGAPLISPEGFVLGTLSVADTKPHILGQDQMDALATLAGQVVSQLELHRHVQELESAEEKYRSIFENAGEGIFQTTADGHYISANPALAKIYGFDSTDALIASVNDIRSQVYVDEGQRERFVREVQDKGFVSGFEARVRHKTGKTIWISENARVVRNADGKISYFEGTVRDITKRKHAEETLKYSEMRFRSVWENSADGMRITNGEGVILAVNPSFCRMVGMKRDELEGQLFTTIYPQEEADIARRLHKYRERFESADFEQHRDRQLGFRAGREVDVEISHSFLELTGRDSLLLTMFHDISERKNAEMALRDSEILYSSLVDSLPQNIFRKDSSERFTFANQKLCKLLGYPLDEILGKTDFDFFPPELAAKYRADDRRILDTGETFEAVEDFIKEGTKRYVQVVKTPLYDANEKICGIQGIFWDVTERKMIEEQLAFERNLLRELLDNIPDRIYFKDRDSAFLRVGRYLADLFGLQDPEDAIGKTDFDFFTKQHAEPAFEDEQEIIRTGIPIVGKMEKEKWSNGTDAWVLSTKMPFRDEAGNIVGTFGISKDITELKQAEEQLEIARDAALETARLKSEFLATMSHEIRTPMNGIIGMTGLLLETPLNPQQRDFSETIRGSANALLDIINDILDFSKIESGKLIFEKVDFDIREVVESTVELLAPRAQGKGIEMVSFLDPDVTPQIKGDPGRLRQVLMNLIGNAVKFTDEGEVVVRVTHEESNEKNITLKLAVTDTGVGIDTQKQEEVFKAFTQADGSTTRKYGGTGLGLAISRQLIELMGGQIQVESSVGKGSTFWFKLKFEKQEEQVKQQLDMSVLEGVRVLVVDDNATNRQILEQQTKLWKMVHASAASAEEAVRMMRQAVAEGNPYELGILDMQMPDMDGLTLAENIQKHEELRSTKLIMLTSLGQRVDLEVLKAAGISACLIKPVKQARLLDYLIQTVAGKETIQQLLSVAVPQKDGEKSAPRRSLRILLAEDNTVNQKVALLQLNKIGYGADTVANGLEAIDGLKRIPYDVVLMDCQMPLMDGYQATREIRELEKQKAQEGQTVVPVYIIAMTANALEGDRDKCIEAGMNDYISKPVNIDALEAALDRGQEACQTIEQDDTDAPAEKVAEPAQESDEPLVDFSFLRSLRDLADGGPDPVVELVDMYLADAPGKVEAILSGAAAGDSEAIKAAAHTLKGSSSNLGAKRLAAYCSDLEKMSNEGEADACKQQADVVAKEFELVKEAFIEERDGKA